MTHARLLVLVLACGCLVTGCRRNPAAHPDYPLQPVPSKDVEITDAFWAPRSETNRQVSIRRVFEMLDEGDAFDTSKLVEAAAYMLARRPDADLESFIDARIERLAARAEARAASPEQAIRISGHFLEAAAAYAEATGKRRMLDVAIRLADVMAAAYGPGRKTYISGHEGLKVGLVRLYRQTGEGKYLDLARFLLDERGKDDYPRQGEYARDRTYAQDHAPVVRQDEAVGHAVRAMFLYIALEDIAALTGERAYVEAGDRLWSDVVQHKTYLTGGVGSIRFHEQFGAPYELPNLSAWNETCASYGNVVWNHRLSLLHRDARYVDAMERVLYNAFLAGVSLEGDRFFYQNPLVSYGHYERFTRINVPCCPPNVVRLLASIGGYIYARGPSDLFVNLFIGSTARVRIGGVAVRTSLETRYPWGGAVKLRVEPDRPARFAVNLRVPGWARGEVWPGELYRYAGHAADEPVMVKVNGAAIPFTVDRGYARIDRRWQPGDVVELDLPMPVREVIAHPSVRDDAGRVALVRGPLVYCAEWPDNGGGVLDLVIPDAASFESRFRPDLLGGVQVVTGSVLRVTRSAGDPAPRTEPHDLVAIPYYAWANRGMGQMQVWMPRDAARARILPVTPPAPIARVTAFGGIERKATGYNDQNDELEAVYDGFDPLSSADESNLYFRMRPPAGQPAWVEYRFTAPTTVSSSEVYWVDDRRFCRLPAGWRVLYAEGSQWKPVAPRGPFTVDRDRFSRVEFDPVTTRAVRLEVEPRAIHYKAGDIGPPEALFLDKDLEWREFGIIEWRVR